MAAPQIGVLTADQEEELQELYNWIDEIPLSRPKKNICRDFADGVLMAEVVAHFHPRLVDLHNYSAANSVNKKTYNWRTLNQKVFRRLGFQLHPDDIEDVVSARPIAIERVLKAFQSVVLSGESIKGGDSGGDGSDRSLTRSLPAKARPSSDDRSRIPPRGGGNVSSLRQLRVNVQNSCPERAAENVRVLKEVDSDILMEKEQTIRELTATVNLLREKVSKLEQLVQLKSSRAS